ncbi:vesicle transport v-snare protein vti1 [Guyanagaster necrorhizus]|uniref:Vesicle transport v-snare protein vti1 n=1 Tax=Guyanagaster necrorhizus TaxID=856835 RepID=A0A9P7VSK4_9AGAR|nr:vesicle transport v-snare protein vti1 [Guyanagaster necrorhizus MCA 3950]KAG7446653.1 vesicle transport v-snare protein vti1 [Guyanagaster necrorhizus MCA 3950]
MDATPTDLFESYHQDFAHLIQSVRGKLEVEVKEQQGEQRKATLRKVEIDLDEADDIISQLEVEIQGIPLSIRSQYSAQLKQAKVELNRYKKLSKDLHSQASRTDLLGSSRFKTTATSDDPYGEGNNRTRLLAGSEALYDGNRRIADSTRIALETETHGADILSNLRVQREQIENTRDTLHTADISIDRSSGTIKGMIRQMYKQRVVLGVLIAVLVLVVLLILYFKLIR